MKTYLAYIEQEHGCDYTIGCGKDLSKFEAEDMTEAIYHVEKAICEWSEEMFETLDTVTIYEAPNSIELNLTALRIRFADEQRIAKEKEDNEKDLREFERLKQKFNK